MTWESSGASCWALCVERKHPVSRQGLSNQCLTQASSMPRAPQGSTRKGVQPGGDGLGRKPRAAAAVGRAGALWWSCTEPGTCPLHVGQKETFPRWRRWEWPLWARSLRNVESQRKEENDPHPGVQDGTLRSPWVRGQPVQKGVRCATYSKEAGTRSVPRSFHISPRGVRDQTHRVLRKEWGEVRGQGCGGDRSSARMGLRVGRPLLGEGLLCLPSPPPHPHIHG